MTTYVLGAGASRQAGYPFALELGNALREWVCRSRGANDDYRVYIDQVLELYGHLRFEEILTDLVECELGSRAATIQRPVRGRLLWALRESVREFFNDLRAQPAEYYERLAHECIRPDDVIITFNYDLALERALKRADLWEIGDGYGFSLNHEIPSSKTRILKLHGSTNWWALLFGGSTGFFQADSGAALGVRPVVFFKSEFEFLGYPPGIIDYHCRGLDRGAGHTAIIMPVLRKRFYEQTSFGREWEPFWQDLWNQASFALQFSDEIVVIGYSMSPADQKARDLLFAQSNKMARISMFCGPQSENLCSEFQQHGFPNVQTSGSGLFENYLNLSSHNERAQSSGD